jgi:protein tyrosine/serine phosphatase
MKTQFLRFLTMALSVLGMASGAFANDAAQPIANFYEVRPELYRGARPQAGGLEELVSFGIKSIVNLQGGDLQSHYPSWLIAKLEPGELPENIEAERAKASSLNMAYLSTPLDSLEDITPAEDLAIDQALQFMANPQNQPVFVHCEHGQDRTGLIVALYEVKYLGMSVEAAHDEMVKHGHDKIHQIVTHDMDEYFYQKVKQFQRF